MAQSIDVRIAFSLAGYLSLIAAAMLCEIGLFVLSRNAKAAVNQLFAAGMLALASLTRPFENRRG